MSKQVVNCEGVQICRFILLSSLEQVKNIINESKELSDVNLEDIKFCLAQTSITLKDFMRCCNGKEELTLNAFTDAIEKEALGNCDVKIFEIFTSPKSKVSDEMIRDFSKSIDEVIKSIKNNENLIKNDNEGLSKGMHKAYDICKESVLADLYRMTGEVNKLIDHDSEDDKQGEQLLERLKDDYKDLVPSLALLVRNISGKIGAENDSNLVKGLTKCMDEGYLEECPSDVLEILNNPNPEEDELIDFSCKAEKLIKAIEK